MFFAAACLVAGRHIHGFLAPNSPAPGARILVVEGWIPGELLDQAVTAFRARGYRRVVTTGGPIEEWLEFRGSSSYADWTANYLRKHGLQDADVTAVSAPASAQ